jgi:hypothetical protein
MTNSEKAAEEIALILASLKDEEDIHNVCYEAKDLALRAIRGWWEMPGSPYFNGRMKSLKDRLFYAKPKERSK